MKKRSSVFPMALAGITAAAVCFGVPWSAASAQLAARHYFGTVGAGDLQRTMPARWASGSIPLTVLRRPAPLIGEHTAEVLADWLGHDRVPAMREETR